MVELSVSTMSTGFWEPLTYLTVTIVFAACAVYLVRRYFEMRQKLTLLFIAFFAVTSVFFFFDLLCVTDVLYFNMTLALEYTYLILATIVAVIGLVMAGVKQLYALPLLVAVIAFVHQTALSSNNTLTVNLIQVFSYAYTGQFIGNPLYITLVTVFPNISTSGQLFSKILNLFLDPLTLIFPAVFIIALYLVAITVPTTVLFYILAWGNRSGRSLGFALGLTTNIILGIFQGLGLISIRTLAGMVFLLIGAAFFALGVLGPFDKLMKREESQILRVKKEKRKK